MADKTEEIVVISPSDMRNYKVAVPSPVGDIMIDLCTNLEESDIEQFESVFFRIRDSLMDIGNGVMLNSPELGDYAKYSKAFIDWMHVDGVHNVTVQCDAGNNTHEMREAGEFILSYSIVMKKRSAILSGTFYIGPPVVSS